MLYRTLVCTALSVVLVASCKDNESPVSEPTGGTGDAETGDGNTDPGPTTGGDGSTGSGGSTGGGDSTGEAEGGSIDPDWTKVEIRFDNFTVPAVDTHYACVGFTLESDRLYHMVGFDPVIDNSNVTHHLVLHRLSSPMGSEPVECFDMPNSIGMSYAWAPGGEALWVPEEAGFLVGDQGPETHFALQIHYENPTASPDHVDSSGIDVYLTDELRQYHAASLVLGNISDLEIPPGEQAFEITQTCDAGQVLTEPINVFASMHHAHYLGRRLWTDHLRGGQVIGDVGREDPYSFDYQRLSQLDVTIEPQDTLEIHCVYDSTDRTEPTGFGFGTEDEMCFNYLLVYPPPAQEFCL